MAENAQLREDNEKLREELEQLTVAMGWKIKEEKERSWEIQTLKEALETLKKERGELKKKLATMPKNQSQKREN